MTEDEMENSYFTEETFSQFEEHFHDSRDVFLDLFGRLKLAQAPRQSVAHQSSVSHRQEVKLPKIEIPKFSGDYKEWSLAKIQL